MPSRHILLLLAALGPVDAVPHAGGNRGSVAEPGAHEGARDRRAKQAEGDAAAYDGPDLGESFAPTSPLIGVSHKFSFEAVTQIPRAMCAPLAATVRRHGHWFDGDDAEPTIKTSADGVAPSSQQAAQRAFMRSIGTKLCARPSQSDDEYTTILHGMLAEVRTHINRHVQSAFAVKASCAFIDDSAACYGSRRGEPTDMLVERDEYDHVAGGCLTSILEHEKYNLGEGFTFLKMSMSLLERGAAFCTEPDRNALVHEMNATIEQAMAYHRSNQGFNELLDAHFAQLCSAEDEYEGQYEEAYQAVAEQVDGDVLSRTEEDCAYDEDIFAKFDFLTSNPPGPSDLVTMFEQNTQVSVIAALSTVRRVLSSGTCVDAKSGAPDAAASSEILADVLSLNSTEDFSGQFIYHALPTVYHKLMLMCMPQDTGYPNVTAFDGVCRDAHGQLLFPTSGSIFDNNPVFDLVTSEDIRKCSGAACKAAAKAIVAYHELLGAVTRMRSNTIRMTTGATPVLPVYEQTAWAWQRSCDAMRTVAHDAATVRAGLPAVATQLRAAVPQLKASCVAPTRVHNATAARVASILGHERAWRNRRIWGETQDKAYELCQAHRQGSDGPF